ncbi:type I asparaginase [Haliangium ochraceum]|uniref:asparaginase n=1 Tax=Haliangium ochraceum (strain DSM 14365 / JCM 11303 / SMP-2) TaxID=502025 RepID=D0LXX2_HALO1|nr:type I asparaginase [Haliangium ochraceum]ACY14327.1 L-asparaginase, type I [Haliangium ochraceum DSM 14365]
MSAVPNILLIYTGGTIGMRKTPAGYQPEPGSLQRLLSELPRFSDPDVPHFDIAEFAPLLDSADMNPSHWLRIAEMVRDNYEDYDGFLVLHGTDTMAFTASALSFMLERLAKPVLLTGSQIPLEETRNDAQNNLLTALTILGRDHARLPEVLIYFAGLLLRGNRATKVSVGEFAAFESPNFAPLGRAGIDIDIDWRRVLPPRARASEAVQVVPVGSANVAAFRLFPGLKPALLEAVLAAPVQGVVLECYGAGNAPTADPAFMRVIAEATARGVVLVDVSQPLRGSADLRLYATGRALLDAGVVGGYDMTAEAALAKLAYLFEKGHGPERVKELVQTPLVGELTRADVPTWTPFRAVDRDS